MVNDEATQGFVLSAVRHYIRLLVAVVLILSFSLVSYLYWHESEHHELEDVTNSYHLETILLSTRIKEEVAHIQARQVNAQWIGRAGVMQEYYSESAYMLGRHFQDISRLHGTYQPRSGRASRFEAVIHKAGRQLDTVMAMLEEAAGRGTVLLAESEMMLLDSFAHSIEQLRRLHTIAGNEIRGELDHMEVSNRLRLLLLLTAALLLGSIVVWRIMSGIRRLVETQQQNETALRQSATVFENASEGIFITDVNANILAVNSAFSRITGYSEEAVLGRNPRMLQSGRHDCDFYRAMWSSLEQHGQWQGEITGRRKNGEIFPKWQTITAVRNDAGRLTHYVSLFSDISHVKESEEKLHHLAHHDALTGLPNRLLLEARLEHSMQQAHREGNHVALLFLDLDDFKKINDSLGHPAGDQLLQLVAERLLEAVRDEDTVARLGGDELTIVLGSLENARDAATVAREILHKLSKPFMLEGQEVFASASIGISLYPQDGRDVTALLKNADAAMYMAKSQGRSGYHFYSRELTVRACESLALETNLYRALEREELLLHFQPQVSLSSGDIVGVEALVRWQDPKNGLISPARFIPLAEANGLIGAIGQWVLRAACTQAMAWQMEGLAPLRIAVNLSGRQLLQGNIVQEIRDVLEVTGLSPSCLELELTESSLMKQAELAAKTLDALRELGTTIAIDDFGTGYSSLGYLKRFSVDRLKIDRSFVRDMPQDANDVAIAKAIVALGHSLNLSVVAEGVETQAQRELLASIGCDEMQGFLYSEPVSASELVSMLGTRDRCVCAND